MCAQIDRKLTVYVVEIIAGEGGIRFGLKLSCTLPFLPRLFREIPRSFSFALVAGALVYTKLFERLLFSGTSYPCTCY